MTLPISHKSNLCLKKTKISVFNCVIRRVSNLPLISQLLSVSVPPHKNERNFHTLSTPAIPVKLILSQLSNLYPFDHKVYTPLLFQQRKLQQIKNLLNSTVAMTHGFAIKTRHAPSNLLERGQR